MNKLIDKLTNCNDVRIGTEFSYVYNSVTKNYSIYLKSTINDKSELVAYGKLAQVRKKLDQCLEYERIIRRLNR